MPHAAIIAAAITAGVGTAVAFEVGVFRPWRESNWPDGIAEGLKREWQEFSDDMKNGFREISGDLRRQRDQRRNNDQQSQRRNDRNESDDVEEEMQLRREMDEFSLHEAQSTGMRSRYANEFEAGGIIRRRNLQGAKAEDYLREDMYLDHLDPHVESYNDTHMALANHDVALSTLSTAAQHLDDLTSLRTLSPSLAPQQTPSLPSVSPHILSHLDHHSPSVTISDSIQEDWQSQLSAGAYGATSNNDEYDEDSGSASWVQLTDSRPSSPRSLTWSDHEMVERR